MIQPGSTRMEFRRHLRRARRQRIKLIGYAVTGIFVCFVAGIIILSLMLLYFAKDLPNPNKLSSRENEELSTKIYDRNGELLYDIYDNRNRTLATIDQIPKNLQLATISIEDKDFLHHKGFDFHSFLRIPFYILTKRQVTGGSTLTQQLVKNTLLTPERTATRKLKEFFLAIQVENKFSKEQILQMYLNEAPYGGAAIGVEAASEQYFGKKVNELDLAQCAILAGLPQSPTYYSPLGNHPDAYKSRTQDVLRRMREDGYISKEQEQQALAEVNDGKITFVPQQISIKAPHFVLYVKELLEHDYGERLVKEGGLRVTTSLDYKVQTIAQNAVREEIAKLKSYKVGNGAAVVLDPKNGDILAMVGGKDYFGKSEPANCTEGKNCVFESAVNTALANRQPGSATKPIAYAVGFKKGYSPATVLMDVPTVFPGGVGQEDYKPANYDAKFHGPVSVRNALANSYNIPAVKMLALVGIRDTMKQGYDMGISNWQPTDEAINNVGLSLVLGGREVSLLDLTQAYASFADSGVHNEPVAILKVTNAKGDKVYFEEKHKASHNVLSPAISFLISHILSDNNARSAVFGTNSSLVVPGKTVAVKTGTTDLKKDNWTIGYTPSIAVGVWVGNNDGSIMDPKISSGVTGAAPIWNRIMREVLKDRPNEDFSKVPEGVVAMQVDELTGGLPKDNLPVKSEYFLTNAKPTEVSRAYQRMNVCKGKPTNFGSDDDVGGGKTDPKDLIAFMEDDPVSGDGKNRWQDGINTWAFSQPDERFKAPYIKGCDANTPRPLMVQITNIPNGANVTKSFDITVGASSQSFTVLKITASVDGKIIKEITGQPYAFHIDLPDTGEHKVKVEAIDSGGNTDSQEITVKGSL